MNMVVKKKKKNRNRNRVADRIRKKEEREHEYEIIMHEYRRVFLNEDVWDHKEYLEIILDD